MQRRKQDWSRYYSLLYIKEQVLKQVLKPRHLSQNPAFPLSNTKPPYSEVQTCYRYDCFDHSHIPVWYICTAWPEEALKLLTEGTNGFDSLSTTQPLSFKVSVKFHYICLDLLVTPTILSLNFCSPYHSKKHRKLRSGRICGRSF
jgi:hypothetical protein